MAEVCKYLNVEVRQQSDLEWVGYDRFGLTKNIDGSFDYLHSVVDSAVAAVAVAADDRFD